MARRLRHALVGSVTLLGLAGCSSLVIQERPAWRAQAENACLARGTVRASASLVPAREMSGPGICGLTHPFKATALLGGAVTLNATQTLDCPMIESLDEWLRDVVQPAAQARFGEPVVRLNALGSYSCRGINNMSGASLSEHAFGNALDIGGFVLASGRDLNITRGFNGPDEQESAFLHEVHAGACGLFTTVLGPGYNILHYNHFHVDLAMHGSTSRGPRRYCKPVPRNDLPQPPKLDTMPDPPAIEEEMDIARGPAPEPAFVAGGPALVASVPPPPPITAMRPLAPPPSRSEALPSPAMALAAPAPGRREPLPSPAEALPAPASALAVSDPRPRAAPLAPPRRLVTFAVQEPEPAPPPSLRRPPPPRPPSSEPEMAPADAESVDVRTGAEAAPKPPAPRRAPGRPSDWDITSSIH